MFSTLKCALSQAITSYGNDLCQALQGCVDDEPLPKLIKVSDNRFCVKFLQLEMGLLFIKSRSNIRILQYIECCLDRFEICYKLSSKQKTDDSKHSWESGLQTSMNAA